MPTPVVDVSRLTPSDAPELFRLIDRNRKHLTQFGDDTGTRYRSVEAVRWRIDNPLEGTWEYRCGIRDGQTGTMVGFIKLTALEHAEDMAEIGYFLGEEFQGRGYMTAAIRELTERALTSLGFCEVWAKVYKDNVRSRRALERCGYRVRGVDPQDSDMVVLATGR